MTLITEIPDQLVCAFGASNAATAIGVTGLYNGQQYYQIGGISQGYRKNIWVWSTGTASWNCLPVSPILGTGNPVGSVTPDAIGQCFLATDTNNFFIATGLTSNDWTLTN